MKSSDPIHSFVDLHLRLVELEREAEVEEASRLQSTLSPSQLEARGVSFLRLKMVHEFSGLGGRLLVELESTTGGDLPASRFQPGDIVLLRPMRGNAPAQSAPTGVIYRLTGRRVTVALDEDLEGEPGSEILEESLRLDRVANDITYRRLRSALESLKSYGKGPAARLREVLFGLRDPAFDLPRPLEPLDSLDASQRAAVAFALEARDIALIHGPPGTGKTTAAVEVIRQAVKRGARVLASAPSNVAVDNLVERLSAFGTRVVRLGHPARLLPSVLEHSLDALVEKSEGARIAMDVRRELEGARRRLRRASTRPERRARRDELRRLRAEARGLEEKAVRDVLSSAEVVLATNTGAGDPLLSSLEFDLVLMDEAAQALEASSWIPLLRGRRAVLVGDHRQLPPTIKSREAERRGLGFTLFDRLSSKYGEGVKRMLTVQYRMHQAIMEWPSRELYGGVLTAHESVANHLLSGLPDVESCLLTQTPLLFIDTAGCDLEEAAASSHGAHRGDDVEGDSKANDGEVEIVVKHFQALLEKGIEPSDIALITPYNAQVDRLRSRLLQAHEGLEIGSVDGFQGREKEAVVISLVRSNARGDVGFLADDRRTNVAVTRARRHLAIVADSSTISFHPFLRRLVEHCEEKGEYRSGWEYR